VLGVRPAAVTVAKSGPIVVVVIVVAIRVRDRVTLKHLD
jgi:hypothetical protein